MSGLLLERIFATLDEARVMEHVHWLTAETPRRISGSGDDGRAADYLAESMRAWGLDVQIQQFPAYNSLPGTAELEISSALPPRELPCLPCAHMASTPPGGIDAGLVHVGPGGTDDYEDLDVRDMLVLAEISYAPPTPEKARIAEERGAAGIIFINWGDSDCDSVSMRALKAVWGNPTPQSWGAMPQIPAVSISRRVGEELMRLCRTGGVRVKLYADCARFWSTLEQPVGFLRGLNSSEEFILVSGHFDAWEPGVTCNATGNAVMLELARVFSGFRDELAREVCFAFWNGHEIAEAAGSTWFVDQHWELLRKRCIAYMNIDSPGLRGARIFEVSASAELRAFAEEVAGTLLDAAISSRLITKTGDQSFLGVGVPSIAGRHGFDDEQLRRTYGATLGWWNHTLEDTLDKIDEVRLNRELRVNAAWLEGLVSASVLPVDPVELIDDLDRRLDYYLRRGVEAEIGLERVAAGLDALRECALQLRVAAADCDPALLPRVNEGLMHCTRELTAGFRTAVSRWEQDTYGSSSLSEPIPLLAGAREVEEGDPSVRHHHITRLVRAKNRLSDSVSRSKHLLQKTLLELGR